MTVTPKAQAYLTELLKDSEALTVGLIAGGCTGYKVSLRKTHLKECTGQSISKCGRVFMTDDQTRRILQDAELILVEDPFSTRLHFVPPKGYDACGCGESFAPNYDKLANESKDELSLRDS